MTEQTLAGRLLDFTPCLNPDQVICDRRTVEEAAGELGRLHTLAKANNLLARHNEAGRVAERSAKVDALDELEFLRSEYVRLQALVVDYKDAMRALGTASIASSVPPEPTLHAYKPHRKWPWFCGECGYPEHERLKHPARDGDSPAHGS